MSLHTLFQILRIGFYEILKLEMPPYAVVDEVRGCMESELEFPFSDCCIATDNYDYP